MRLVRNVLPLLLMLLMACGTSYRYPYTSQQLVRDARSEPAVALLHYLGQDGADGSVCAAGGDMTQPTPKTTAKVAGAIAAQRVAAGPAVDCLQHAFAGFNPAARNVALQNVGEHLMRGWKRGGPGAVVLQETMLEVLDRGSDGPAIEPLLGRVREAIIDSEWSVTSLQSAQAFEEVAGLLLGQWRGKQVTSALIAAEQDPETLKVFATKLTDPTLARQASAQYLRPIAKGSRFSVVRKDIDGAVKRVLDTGVNAVTLRKRRVTASFDTAKQPVGRIVVQQNLSSATSVLSADGTSVLPTFDLSGWLQFRVRGIDQPITLCGDPADRSLDPCVRASDIQLSPGLVELDEAGVVRFADTLPTADALKYLIAPEGLMLAVSFGSKKLAEASVPVYFAPPASLRRVLSGPPSKTTPHLRVSATRQGVNYLVEVREASKVWKAVVHANDAAAGRFQVISQGATGTKGQRGQAGIQGIPGNPGSPAACPSTPGTRGSAGGQGGDGGGGSHGGDGGRGGKVVVDARCGDVPCSQVRADLKAMVVSLGGKGGAGGSGGAGGRGGAGGAAGKPASCGGQRLPGGRKGAKGRDGARGKSGIQGNAGPPGSVKITARR